jgi:predicted RNA-binding protein
MGSLYDFKKFRGTLNQINLACHSIVLELEDGLRLAFECDAIYQRQKEASVPLRNVIGNLCGQQIIRTIELDTGDVRIELEGDAWITIEATGIEDGGDWPVYLMEPTR